jgi:ATP-dependent DNA helicase Rep
LLDLSQQQKAAVQYTKGPLLILAGAGGGKTSLLACKIAWLLREYDVDPSRIVALTPIVHTARTLRSRVEEVLGCKLPGLPVFSFAEFGLRFIEENLDAFGLRSGFSLYDREESKAVVRRLLQEGRPQAADLAPAVVDEIARDKRDMAPPVQGEAQGSSAASVAAWIYPRYQQRLLAANALDVDDLTRKPVRLLTTGAALLRRLRDQIGFLLVDDYEYTSACERELTRLLAAGGMALTVAGDDTRTIDDAAHSPADNLVRLPSELAGLRVVRLEQNFRCTGRVARAASRIAAGAGGSSDVAPHYAQDPGGPIRILQARNEQHEAEAIVADLMAHEADAGIGYRNYAILFRRPEHAAALERALQLSRVPYHWRGVPTFFAQPEIRDLWAYLRILCNPADDDAFLRALNTPRRDIDHAILERLVQLSGARGRPLLECALDPEFMQTLPPQATQTLRGSVQLLQRMIDRAAHADPGELAQDLLTELHYADWLRDSCNDAKIAAQRMGNVLRIVDILRRASRGTPDAGLRSIFTRLQLRAILNGDDDESVFDGVALLTFAAARGTEFAHIYIVGFEDGLLPATEAADIDAGGERRLARLLITRARESVTLTIAEQRRLAGGVTAPRPSRFLADLPEQDLQWVNATGGAFAENSLANSATYIDSGRYRPR